MANTSSAKKAMRAAEKRRVFNARRKKTMKDAVKDMSKLVLGKKEKEAAAMLPTVYKAIDKAAKEGTIKKNTAARMKSQAARALRSLTT
ncbi:30S ribosomal protein S20 [Candidatus Kaiserbacteria bacterium RIFCSPHIGHO2_02_FULL_55_20]|uniref:Small ribosomal subunit protein bS20 n=1 Tax=Candidatus Kaiserbacteria bacterium RIFCSPHIGHO2_02_FULL_55_20 TaxID=1798497 RepID=A0A1F6DYP5_9BACT|nr:MAG: 30S ribosomal protein S20 [Candidatus Kaiserbacteria bacterium RIFCSPHIGHO2_01_FULL_55_37]OGG66541.1 MAG: 30S ribosomal protein S20 [Candidatus Kaiserbacteria bacterium RIFCSPHIGHO2_02_FULL_55_20]